MLLRFKHTKKINKNVNQFHFENLQIVIDFFYFSWMLFKCWKNVIMLTSNYLLFIFYMFSFLPAQVNRIVFVLSWWKLTIVCTLIYQSEIRKMEQTPSLLNVSITQFFLFIFMELQHSYNVAFHANKFNEKNCVQYKLNVKTKKKRTTVRTILIQYCSRYYFTCFIFHKIQHHHPTTTMKAEHQQKW